MREAELIFHVARQEVWDAAQRGGRYEGDTLGTEGFIHCSRPSQLDGVVERYFRGVGGLVLLSIDPARVEPEIRWEGEAEPFPHIYGPLNLDAVTQAAPFDARKREIMPTIRPATEADAEQLISLIHSIADEPGNNILFYPGEFDVTVEQEREILRRTAASETDVFLVADVGGQVVAVGDIHGGRRKALRHVGVLGISVAREWRGKGVGTAMMTALLDWARKTGILERIELNVFARNAIGIKLYERVGFVVEGRRRRAVVKEGEYLDDILMARIFEPRKDLANDRL